MAKKSLIVVADRKKCYNLDIKYANTINSSN